MTAGARWTTTTGNHLSGFPLLAPVQAQERSSLAGEAEKKPSCPSWARAWVPVWQTEQLGLALAPAAHTLLFLPLSMDPLALACRQRSRPAFRPFPLCAPAACRFSCVARGAYWNRVSNSRAKHPFQTHHRKDLMLGLHVFSATVPIPIGTTCLAVVVCH